MQNLLTSEQIKATDSYTVTARSITSLDLMEEASAAFVSEFEKEVPDKNIPVSIYCGTGNNGGDGLAVARMLNRNGYHNLSVKISRFSKQSTSDFNANLKRLKTTGVGISEISNLSFGAEDKSGVIIDALLGSGINRPIEGDLKNLVDHINALNTKVISIDVPSGFPSEGLIDPGSTMIKASLVISFQQPKINFFFPESAINTGRFIAALIGLDAYIESLESNWKLVTNEDIQSILKPRTRFSHKGTYGHPLVIAGSETIMGAALLCADACLHSGAGLTSACIPKSGLTSLNSRSPEIMSLVRSKNIPVSTFKKYTAIALGPAMGVNKEAAELLLKVLASNTKPLVLDADALTLLSKMPDALNSLPAKSILTPHMKEFDRMFGGHTNWWERVETARKKAAELNIIILLKNQYSFIVLPDGDVLINPTGNPAMAVGGMGDVLTGMIVSFLAQEYSAEEAAILGCYLHGKAGDELRAEGMNSIPPGYLIKRLPYVIAHYS
ncbi:MAG: NAD(P)H-hydrate dehydratase [Bacteroidota bacterium]